MPTLKFFPEHFSFKQKLVLGLVAAFLIYLPLGHIIRSLLANCAHLVDYGIYQQAIYEIAAGNSWNPYVSVRDIFIFNEHFDPVIYLAVPFTWLSNYSHLSLGIFEWTWYLLFALSSWYLFKPKSTKDFILLFSFALCSRGIIAALAFTGHPVTWAIFPLLLLTYFLKEDNFKGVLLTCLSLCFFKETFAFGIVGLSGSYLLRKQWREFTIIFILGAFFVLFEMKFRAILIGKTLAYGNQFLGQILLDPVAFFRELIVKFDFKSLVKLFIPFYVPVFLIVNKKVKNRDSLKEILNSFELRLLSFFLPLLLIHIIINRFFFHHASKFSVLMIGLVLFSGIHYELKKKKWVFCLTVIAALLGGMSTVKKLIKNNFGPKIGQCRVIPEKKNYDKKIKAITETISPNQTIYTTGGIGPFILKPDLKLHHHTMNKRLEQYDYLLLEKNESASIWPLNSQEVRKIEEQCLSMASEVFLNNNLYFFAKGPFKAKCIFNGTTK